MMEAMRNPRADRVTASYEYCRALHRAHGRSYYLATRLLPAWKRRHVHALYGFTRYTDEIVDRLDGLGPARCAARLRAWSDRFEAAADGAVATDPVLPAIVTGTWRRTSPGDGSTCRARTSPNSGSPRTTCAPAW